MNNGIVEFFNTAKGFGLFEPTDGARDVFVHNSAVEWSGMTHLFEGQKVSHAIFTDHRSGRTAAENLQTA
ncbi:cold-shock protein [Ciceribacter azotifigens]|uniref:cold-shock protein n=1 Tax=Ciceribacter azotifigens TaxID=2069303 RepID=UPI003A881C0B